MENKEYPTDRAQVTFTDMQGISRHGIYLEEKHGYQEDSDQELSAETEQVFPEDEIVEWKYL